MEARLQGELVSFFADQRPLHGDVQVQQVVRDEVGQVTVFGVIPDLFDGVEFWGIGRKPVEIEPVRMLLGDLT